MPNDPSSSSISSSDSRAPRLRTAQHLRAAFIVGACVVATLAALEVVSRVVLVQASKDLRRFRSYPETAHLLTEAKAFRVALVGNSATDRGVDIDGLTARLSAPLGRPLRADKFVADASRINDWYHILDRYFWRPGRQADLYLVTFYEDDIEDGNAIEIGRLAQFFTTISDWPGVFDVDLPALGDRIEFVVASGWASFAFRSRMRERALEAVVPRFRPFATAVNDVNVGHLRRRAPATAGPVGYRALDRLLAAARAHASRLVFVAYPTPDWYEIPTDGARRIAEAGMTLLDLRSLAPDLQPRHYADDVHLTPEGATIYSRRLADAVGAMISR